MKSEIPPIPPHLDPDLCQDALDLLSEPSTKSPLDDLPEHQREAIITLLQDYPLRHVAKLLAEPPPLGLGLKIGKSSLGRLKKRHENELHEKDGLTNINAIEKSFALTSDPAQMELDMQTLIQRLLTGRLLKRVANPRSTPQELNILIRSLNNLRRQHLLEQKVHVELLDKLVSTEFKEKSATQPTQNSNNESSP